MYVPFRYCTRTGVYLKKYVLFQISGYLKSSKVKQVMADLALSQVNAIIYI